MQTFIILELVVTLVFTLEYIVRTLCWPKPAKYVFSFWGIIDLITVLPLYVMWLWPEVSLTYLFVWRALRAIRVLRILKLLRYMPSLKIFWAAIVSARHQLMVFYFLIAIVMIVFGSLMYGVEGADNGFTTLGSSVYWAIVTTTTVGYGDIVPHTAIGRAVSSLLILIGYSVIAIPTRLITTHMSKELPEPTSCCDLPLPELPVCRSPKRGQFLQRLWDSLTQTSLKRPHQQPFLLLKVTYSRQRIWQSL